MQIKIQIEKSADDTQEPILTIGTAAGDIELPARDITCISFRFVPLMAISVQTLTEGESRADKSRREIREIWDLAQQTAQLYPPGKFVQDKYITPLQELLTEETEEGETDGNK